MGQVFLLDFFEPSSQRLPPSPEQTTVDDYEDDESRSIQSNDEEVYVFYGLKIILHQFIH